MWDLLTPGIEPVSPELAGGFSTSGPPGKSQTYLVLINQAWMWAPPLKQSFSTHTIDIGGGESSVLCIMVCLASPASTVRCQRHSPLVMTTTNVSRHWQTSPGAGLNKSGKLSLYEWHCQENEKTCHRVAENIYKIHIWEKMDFLLKI